VLVDERNHPTPPHSFNRCASSATDRCGTPLLPCTAPAGNLATIAVVTVLPGIPLSPSAILLWRFLVVSHWRLGLKSILTTNRPVAVSRLNVIARSQISDAAGSSRGGPGPHVAQSSSAGRSTSAGKLHNLEVFGSGAGSRICRHRTPFPPASICRFDHRPQRAFARRMQPIAAFAHATGEAHEDQVAASIRATIPRAPRVVNRLAPIGCTGSLRFESRWCRFRAAGRNRCHQHR